MIPYEELVHALQEWRARQGLGAAPSMRPRVSAQVAAPVPAAPHMPPPPQPGRGSGAFTSLPPAPVLPVSARPLLDDFDGDAGTEIRDGGGDDEIDVDAEAVDVIDEQIEDE